MKDLIFKIATLNDLSTLCEIAENTYSETFSNENTLENMKAYLHKAFNTKKLQQELANKDSQFYFVNYNNEVCGYLKINFNQAQTELKEPNGMELERIYLLQTFQGLKIGSAMLNFVIQIAKQKSLDYLWLGVWNKNLKAINFYKKFGFTIVGEHPFIMGADVQTDYIMKLQLFY